MVMKGYYLTDTSLIERKSERRSLTDFYASYYFLSLLKFCKRLIIERKIRRMKIRKNSSYESKKISNYEISLKIYLSRERWSLTDLYAPYYFKAN